MSVCCLYLAFWSDAPLTELSQLWPSKGYNGVTQHIYIHHFLSFQTLLESLHWKSTLGGKNPFSHQGPNPCQYCIWLFGQMLHWLSYPHCSLAKVTMVLNNKCHFLLFQTTVQMACTPRPSHLPFEGDNLDLSFAKSGTLFRKNR